MAFATILAMNSVIHANELTKRFGDFTAVDSISFSVSRQECFGFLGPNGAGKSSTIGMITAISPVTSGHLEVGGLDVVKRSRMVRRIVGVVPQEDTLDDDMTAIQNLRVYARYYDMPAPLAQSRSRELLDLFQLTDKANSEVDALSGGMRRRLLIARALLHSPSILILDEPTTGLDPQAKHLVWQKLRLLKAQGTTMLLTTHNMEEAAILCDQLVIMDYGRILVQGIPAELVAQHVGSEVAEVRFSAQARDAVTKQLLDMNMPFQDGGDRFYVYSVDGQLPEQLASAYDWQLERRPANLEDVFFRLTGRDLRDE